MKLSLYTLLGCAALLVFSALLTPPYGFYRFLRIAIFIVSLYYAYDFFRSSYSFFTLLFLILAIFYNPIYPIFLAKAIWQPINIASAVFFLFIAFRFYRSKI